MPIKNTVLSWLFDNLGFLWYWPHAPLLLLSWFGPLLSLRTFIQDTISLDACCHIPCFHCVGFKVRFGWQVKQILRGPMAPYWGGLIICLFIFHWSLTFLNSDLVGDSGWLKPHFNDVSLVCFIYLLSQKIQGERWWSGTKTYTSKRLISNFRTQLFTKN